ncbi:hypothetical protein TSOC_001190, partial [Tetrabaena socialis]
CSQPDLQRGQRPAPLPRAGEGHRAKHGGGPRVRGAGGGQGIRGGRPGAGRPGGLPLHLVLRGLLLLPQGGHLQ